jgi:hydroxyacylglutathione hydrolase
MILRQFLNANTGCASYVVGCAGHGRAAVIDPQFEFGEYVDMTSRYGMKIEAVLNTHVHADHRSGGRRLAEAVSAPLYFHRTADLRYDFKPLDDGEEISLGNVVIRALHTPGHTPESISLLVTDLTRGAEPWMVLTGDTLFVGDVGRPDLGGDDAARDLHSSLQRLIALPDYLEVYPAHISGSPCGRSMSGKPSSTIGFERRYNKALKCKTRDDFVTSIFEDVPPKPEDFLEVVAFNRSS